MAKTHQNQPASSETSASEPRAAASAHEGDAIALPAHAAGSGTLDRLVDTARDYARAATAENTNKAYAGDQ